MNTIPVIREERSNEYYRHCEEWSDEAIYLLILFSFLDCFALLAMAAMGYSLQVTIKVYTIYEIATRHVCEIL